MTADELLNIMQSKWNQGDPLFTIFQKVKQGYSDRATAQAIFHAFIKKNKHDKKFMDEFNSTCFDLT
jgi:hypothetical protein